MSQIKGFNSLTKTVSINNWGHFNEALLDFPLKINVGLLANLYKNIFYVQLKILTILRILYNTLVA